MSHQTPYSYEADQEREFHRAALKPRFPSAAKMAQRVPPHFRDITLDDYEARTEEAGVARQATASVIKNIERGVPMKPSILGLTLLGHPGLGKTMLACCVLNHARECRKSFDFMPVADFVDIGHRLIALGQRFSQLTDEEYQKYKALDQRIEQMTQVKVLVLDDFGKEHSRASALPGAASWAESEFDRIIRNRWNTGVGPTIITTNVFLDEWEARYRKSLVSFLHESTVICEMNQQGDWRGEG